MPEDPIKRLVRQQQQEEASVTSATRLPYAKQRDSGDPDFNYQGPQTYRGGNFGHGTKDRMPGTTPLIPPPEPNFIDRVLELLKIRKKQNSKPKKMTIKYRGNDLI
jgi:hypothetical protein